MKISLIALIAIVALFRIASAAEGKKQSCPLRPLGISTSKDSDGTRFYATAQVKPFGEAAALIEDAKQDARLAARVMLRKYENVPHTKTGQLLGIKDLGTCIFDGQIYSTIGVNEQSAKQAVELHDRIQQSMKDHPTPTEGSYSHMYGRENSPPKEQ